MADETEKDQKTEDATPRRLEEARNKGQVSMSTEFVAALGLAVGAAMLAVGSKPLFEAVGRLLVDTINSIDDLGVKEIGVPEAAGILKGSLFSVTGAIGMVLSPAIVMAAMAGYGQVGFRIAPEAIKVDIEKLNVIKGFGRIFGMRGAMRVLQSGAKITAIASTVAFITWRHVEEVSRVGTSELGPMLLAVSHIAIRATAGALLVIVLLSLVDLIYQRWQHTKDMRMSKQEVKEEAKQSDGDPKIKARIRQLQIEMSTRRMMDDVPDATVVVTNPTHYAVALRYDSSGVGVNAPICVAKGVDAMAQRIKQVAVEAGVPLHEDVPLARGLHAKVEVGEEIPEELFAAVAAVLSQVYRTKEAVARA
ncbi:MAG: flagellar biosynthetic protein FlhB [Planctomycetota bacterium]|jgi:flagellar biosynthetic protein FlhB